MDEKARIVIVDDHEIVRLGIEMLFENEDSIEVIGTGSSGKEALKLVDDLKPDILVLDISMPEMTGLETLQELNKTNTETKTLFLSMYDKEDYILKAIEYGAVGYLLKDTEKERFLKAIRKLKAGEKYFSSEVSTVIVNQYLTSKDKPSSKNQVSNNDYGLTRRESDILSRIISGNSNQEISEDCNISIRTIEKHRLNMMKKLDVNNAADMVRLAIEEGLT